MIIIAIVILLLILVLIIYFFYQKEYTVFDKLNYDVNNIIEVSGLKAKVKIYESDKLNYWEGNKIFIVKKKGMYFYNYDTLIYICLSQLSKMLSVNSNEKSIMKLLEKSSKKLGLNCSKTEDYLTI